MVDNINMYVFQDLLPDTHYSYYFACGYMETLEVQNSLLFDRLFV